MPNNGLRDYESYTVRGGATFSDTLSKLRLCIHRQPSDSCLNCRSHPSFFSYLGPEKKAFDDFEPSHLFHVWVLFVHRRPGTERKALPLKRSELPTVVQAVACKTTHHGRHSDRENRARSAFLGLSWVARVWKFCILPGLISWHSGILCPLVYSADFDSIPFAISAAFTRNLTSLFNLSRKAVTDFRLVCLSTGGYNFSRRRSGNQQAMQSTISSTYKHVLQPVAVAALPLQFLQDPQTSPARGYHCF